MRSSVRQSVGGFLGSMAVVLLGFMIAVPLVVLPTFSVAQGPAPRKSWIEFHVQGDPTRIDKMSPDDQEEWALRAQYLADCHKQAVVVTQDGRYLTVFNPRNVRRK